MRTTSLFVALAIAGCAPATKSIASRHQTTLEQGLFLAGCVETARAMKNPAVARACADLTAPESTSVRNAIREGCEGAILTVRPSPDVEEMVRLFQNCHELAGRLLDSDPVHVAGK